MEIEYAKGDIFESGCQALVNPVNCVGVMGAGLALEFKKRFPNYFQEYVHLCKLGIIELGAVNVHFLKAEPGSKIIFSFPTKYHFNQASELAYIDDGLNDLAAEIEHLGITSIAVPALGCGLGGLEWQHVRPLIDNYLGSLASCRVLVYYDRGIAG